MNGLTRKLGNIESKQINLQGEWGKEESLHDNLGIFLRLTDRG